ncbi:unnamed protein product [Brassica rapa]|uniref:BnaA07g37230D protein n=2 Tax=Brassica TaxID=3705 RepID=A0A078JN96_BRANA|nr:unnamed protein product [Brassica rapa]CDY66817.1 BnaA07g37230D [Brassica napus]VDC96134.1 unnamed protein product [Brassica rapa]
MILNSASISLRIIVRCLFLLRVLRAASSTIAFFATPISMIPLSPNTSESTPFSDQHKPK